jgi:hypothetical protein
VMRGDQEQEGRRARSPTFSSDRPACAHSASNWQSPAQRRKNPKFFLSLSVVFADSVPDHSGDPLVSRVSASGSCLTISGDASEGCTSYRTIVGPKAAAWARRTFGARRGIHSKDATVVVE